MHDVLKSLSSYVDHSEHITKRMKAIQEFKKFEIADKQELKAERRENVEKSLKKQYDELEKKKAKIRKIEREKAKQIILNKKELEQASIRKRELLNLKRIEIEENNMIEKNLRLNTKKRLVEKQK